MQMSRKLGTVLFPDICTVLSYLLKTKVSTKASYSIPRVSS